MTEELEQLRKKYFPRIPWDETDGPVRRKYLVKTAGEADGAPAAVLAALAEREGFTEPEQRTVIGDGEACLAAFREKAAHDTVGMIFGTELAAHWCDIAVTPAAEEDGWSRMLVRSEEGENLTALAYGEGALLFRRAE